MKYDFASSSTYQNLGYNFSSINSDVWNLQTSSLFEVICDSINDLFLIHSIQSCVNSTVITIGLILTFKHASSYHLWSLSFQKQYSKAKSSFCFNPSNTLFFHFINTKNINTKWSRYTKNQNCSCIWSFIPRMSNTLFFFSIEQINIIL